MEISICSGDYRVGFSFIAYLLGLLSGWFMFWVADKMGKQYDGERKEK
jgi:hypothetical protein